MIAASRSGALTIEHASRAGEAGLLAMKDHNVIMAPTLSVLERLHSKKFPLTARRLLS